MSAFSALHFFKKKPAAPVALSSVKTRDLLFSDTHEELFDDLNRLFEITRKAFNKRCYWVVLPFACASGMFAQTIVACALDAGCLTCAVIPKIASFWAGFCVGGAIAYRLSGASKQRKILSSIRRPLRVYLAHRIVFLNKSSAQRDEDFVPVPVLDAVNKLTKIRDRRFTP